MKRFSDFTKLIPSPQRGEGAFAGGAVQMRVRGKKAAFTLAEVENNSSPNQGRQGGVNDVSDTLNDCLPTPILPNQGGSRDKFPRPLRERVRERGQKCAFTLAEVLITLGIIGVVAAVTMPILIQNINERVNSEREANIAQKITQAMEQMRAHGLLNTTYNDTDAFVDELQNYLRIAKRCDSSHIAECWPTSTVIDTNGEEYDVSKAKTGKDLQIKKSVNGEAKTSDTNNVGIVLADGGAIILNYFNPNSTSYDVGSRVTASKKSLTVGGGKTKEFAYTTDVTSIIDYVVDVNGKSGPNSQQADKKNDIRSFNVAKFGTGCSGTKLSDGTCVKQITKYEPVTDASKSTFVSTYCPNYSWGCTDYWLGAIDACEAIGMELPDKDKLLALYGKKGQDGIPSDGYFWSSSENTTGYAWYVNFDLGYSGDDYKDSQGYGVLCVGK